MISSQQGKFGNRDRQCFNPTERDNPTGPGRGGFEIAVKLHTTGTIASNVSGEDCSLIHPVMWITMPRSTQIGGLCFFGCAYFQAKITQKAYSI